jgi:hypothetical protein
MGYHDESRAKHEDGKYYKEFENNVKMLDQAVYNYCVLVHKI